MKLLPSRQFRYQTLRFLLSIATNVVCYINCRSIIHQYNLLHRGIGVMVFDSIGRIYVHQRSSSKRLFPSMYDMFIGGVCTTKESSIATLLRELKEEVGLEFTINTDTAIDNDEIDKFDMKNDNDYDDLNSSTTKNNDGAVGKDLTPYAMKKLLQYEYQSINSPKYKSKSIRYLGETTIQTDYNHCIVDCYMAICSKDMEDKIQFNDGEVQWGKWLTLNELNVMLAEKEDQFVPDGMQVWHCLPKIMKNVIL